MNWKHHCFTKAIILTGTSFQESQRIKTCYFLILTEVCLCLFGSALVSLSSFRFVKCSSLFQNSYYALLNLLSLTLSKEGFLSLYFRLFFLTPPRQLAFVQEKLVLLPSFHDQYYDKDIRTSYVVQEVKVRP